MFSNFSTSQLILYVVIIVLVMVALGMLIGFIPAGRQTQQSGGTITLWVFKGQSDAWDEVTGTFAKDTVSEVKYQILDESNYGETLLNALAAGTGPDVFMLKDSQLLRYEDKIAPFPPSVNDGPEETVVPPTDFKRVFIDGVQEGLINSADIAIGMPLALDPLALFYNKDFFNSENISQPPATWDEFLKISQTLTRKSDLGFVERSGAALGEVDNIEHFVDIVSALILQTGTRIINPVTRRAEMNVSPREEAGVPSFTSVDFYTSFANPFKKNYSWPRTYPNSIDAFAQEQTLMMFGFASDIPKIISRNPHLNFGIAPFPQLSDSPIKRSYGRFLFLAVSRKAQNKDLAKRFVKYAVSHDSAARFLESAGLAPARRDLVTPGKNVPERLYPFYNQALAARTWLQPSENQVSPIFRDMIESILSKKFTVDQAVSRANNQLQEIIPKPIE